VSPGPNGAFFLGPPPSVTPSQAPSVDWSTDYHEQACDGTVVDASGISRTLSEQFGAAFSLYGPIGGFTPDPTDATHYVGKNTVTLAPNVTATLTWDIRRR
jgi:hypothetical protein